MHVLLKDILSPIVAHLFHFVFKLFHEFICQFSFGLWHIIFIYFVEFREVSLPTDSKFLVESFPSHLFLFTEGRLHLFDWFFPVSEASREGVVLFDAVLLVETLNGAVSDDIVG